MFYYVVVGFFGGGFLKKNKQKKQQNMTVFDTTVEMSWAGSWGDGHKVRGNEAMQFAYETSSQIWDCRSSIATKVNPFLSPPSIYQNEQSINRKLHHTVTDQAFLIKFNTTLFKPWMVLEHSPQATSSTAAELELVVLLYCAILNQT